MAAFVGGFPQASIFTSCGLLGVSSGLKLLETTSKMPAFCRSEKRTWLKVDCSAVVFGSAVVGLKSATAMRTRSTPWVTTPWNLSFWENAEGETKNTNNAIAIAMPCNEHCHLKPVILSPSFRRRAFRNTSGWCAASRLLNEISRKSQDSPLKMDAFREVLRPKDGLRITDVEIFRGAKRDLGLPINILISQQWI